MLTNVVDHPEKVKNNSYLKRGSGPRLVAYSSIIRGKVISLESARWVPFVIGASPDCDFMISGSTMQDFHVAIEQVDGHWVLSVLDKNARVWVNNEPVQVAVLDQGDQVQLGRHLLVFLVDDPAMEERLKESRKRLMSIPLLVNGLNDS